jgi:uncharacterized protein (TIGR00730 family)
VVQSVCVFCGSAAGARPAYLKAAQQLGKALAERGLTLVYGGATVGLLGAVADAALAKGGRVIGVLPDFLRTREIAHSGLTELRLVASLEARKALMVELSDAFIALPGGFGTLDELFEVLTQAQLGLHDKPCGLLDVEAYFEKLEGFLDLAVGEGFVRAAHRARLICEREEGKLLERLGA